MVFAQLEHFLTVFSTAFLSLLLMLHEGFFSPSLSDLMATVLKVKTIKAVPNNHSEGKIILSA